MLFLKHSGPYVFEYVMSSLLLLKSFPMQMKHARTNTSSPHWDMLPSFSQMLLYGEPPSYLKSPLGTCLEGGSGGGLKVKYSELKTTHKDISSV